jgi:two-component system, LytTR family, response regulator
MPYRALLVDDERLARKQLRALLADFPEVEIVAEAAAVPEALAAVQQHRLDVVFLDIQMPGASGFDFLESAEGTFATIFVTAHEQQPNYSYSVLLKQSKCGLMMSRRRALWLKERLA